MKGEKPIMLNQKITKPQYIVPELLYPTISWEPKIFSVLENNLCRKKIMILFFQISSRFKN